MAQVATVVETRFRVVLVAFWEDPNVQWHMRCLLVHGGESKWVAATPDHDLELLDLAARPLIPVRSGEALPARVHGNVYVFDDFEDGEEETLLANGREYGAAVGLIKAEKNEMPGVWRVNDTSSELFGKPVPDECLMDEDSVVMRGATGLVQIDEVWRTMEKVKEESLDKWRAEKGHGPGHDNRVIGWHVNSRGKRHIREEEASELWLNRPVADSPLRGPPVAQDFFDALKVAGITLIGHHTEWRTRSGVGEKAAVTKEHFYLTEALRYDATLDQLDMTQLVGAEFRVRRLLQIEAAVSRNPRMPDFEGLDLMLTSAVAPDGGIVTEKFTEWLTSRQRDAAQIMKQGRLLREERAAEGKRRGGGKNKEQENP